MRYLSEHCYFLDANMAYETALLNNGVETDQNTEIQICYYDGEQFDNPPPNLVRVPVKSFAQFFTDNDLPLPSYFHCETADLSAHEAEQLQKSFIKVVNEVKSVREVNELKKTDQSTSHDSYFFDRDAALSTALNNNRVKTLHPTIDGTQICYYDGEAFDNPPDNLINVPFQSIYEYLLKTKNRLPNNVVYPAHATLEQREDIYHLYAKILNSVIDQRSNIANEYRSKIRVLKPDIKLNKPFRVMLPSFRLTTVMQYVSQNLSRAFQRLGHDVLFHIEENDMQHYDEMIRFKAHFEFKPDVIVNVNHFNNHYLHDDVINVMWWQDAMPEIKQGDNRLFRDNDIVFSLVKPLDNYLYERGAKSVIRQSSCVDTTIFKPLRDIHREEKIIFIGSSYLRHRLPHKNNDVVINFLSALLQIGSPITEKLMRNIAKRYDMEYEHIFWNLHHYIVRDNIVEWLCQNPHTRVEIYGYDWQYNPVVKPYYKGSIPHGQSIVQAYNSAKYALVAHPFDINSQRLAEAVACGCIPVVYDCRHSAEKPHWDDELMYFKTREDLYRLLGSGTGKPAPHMVNYFSYDSLAKRIENLVYEIKLKQNQNSTASAASEQKAL